MDKKYCLVTQHYKEGQFIMTTNDPNCKMVYEGGTLTSMSPKYDSIEELKIGQKILDFECTHCGGLISTTYYKPYPELLAQRKLCFTCNFWYEIKELLKDRTRVVIEGVTYKIEPDNKTNDSFKGHGGRMFKIKRFDSDEIVITKNLWCNGHVPESWKLEIQDNAVFIQ